MPAFLSPDGKTRLVVDRVISYDKGLMICELQGQFFGMNGAFLEDMSIAERLPEPYRTRAIKFVKQYREAKDRETAVAQPPPSEATPPAPKHAISPELQHVLDIRTSDERARGDD